MDPMNDEQFNPIPAITSGLIQDRIRRVPSDTIRQRLSAYRILNDGAGPWGNRDWALQCAAIRILEGELRRRGETPIDSTEAVVAEIVDTLL
jgi:hypothetical protein